MTTSWSQETSMEARMEARKPSTENRLTIIRNRLSSLGDSLVPGLMQRANFSVVEAPIQELIRGIARSHDLNISIHHSINREVTNNFNDVLVKDLLLFLCKEYSLDIVFTNSILSFYPYDPNAGRVIDTKNLDISHDPSKNTVILDLQRDSLYLFVKQFTHATGKNVVADPAVREILINGYVKDLDIPTALRNIAISNNLELKITEDSTFVFQSKHAEPDNPVDSRTQNTSSSRRSSNRRSSSRSRSGGSSSELRIDVTYHDNEKRLVIQADNANILDLIREASQKVDASYILLSPPNGSITCRLNQVTFEEMLSLALQPTTHSFKQIEGKFVIGDRKKDGLGSTSLYIFRNRSVEEIDQSIPKNLVGDIELTLFNDLNGVIMNGDPTRISVLKDFLRQIDQAVPNILIEVIVANVRRGSSISTGIKGGLADSTAKTTGSVFPGVDMTLSTNVINGVFDRLTDNGIIKLGKVTPNFYVSLQALEDNNMLDLRSTPNLSTLNGNEATLTIGNSVYYKIETQNVSGGVTPIVTTTPRFEKVEANLAIKIIPFVSGNEDITLSIEAEFSDFIDPTIEGAPPGNSTRQFVSKIRVKNEEMVVLGGLEEERKSESGAGFPILGRLPVLKWIFSSKTKEESKSRLMIFIKPTIVY